MNGNDEIELIENNVELYDKCLLKVASKKEIIKAIKNIDLKNNEEGLKLFCFEDLLCSELSCIESVDWSAKKELVELLKGE